MIPSSSCSGKAYCYVLREYGRTLRLVGRGRGPAAALDDRLWLGMGARGTGLGTRENGRATDGATAGEKSGPRSRWVALGDRRLVGICKRPIDLGQADHAIATSPGGLSRRGDVEAVDSRVAREGQTRGSIPRRPLVWTLGRSGDWRGPGATRRRDCAL